MRARLRRLFAWWLVAIGLVADATARPVKLGLIAPPNEPDSTSLLRGVRLAVAAANQPPDAPVELEVRSETGQWGTVGNDAVALVCTRHVDALIAPSDGAASHLVLQVSGRTRVPVASLCPDVSVTEAGVPWAVRVVPRTDQAAETIFRVVREPDRTPLHWWAVIPADRPGRAIRRDLELAARRATTPIDRFLTDGSPDADDTATANAIAAAAPAGVLLWLPPSRAGAIAGALCAAGYHGRLAGLCTLESPSFLSAAATAAEGVLAVGFQVDASMSTRVAGFEQQYRQRYHAAPDFSAAAAYDAANVLIEVLRHAEAGAADRAFPLASTTPGVTGVLRFDRAGNRLGTLQVTICRTGRFVPFSSGEP